MEEIEKREFQVGQNKCAVRVLSNGERHLIQSFIDGKPYETIEADQFEKVGFAMEQAIQNIHKDVLSKIYPTQAYFYTPEWQALEKKAENDINTGNVSKSYAPDDIDGLFADIKKGKRQP